MVDFDAMLGRALSALGTAATYTPDGGSAVSITVIPAQEDEIIGIGNSRILSDDRGAFEVRVSDLATPAEGDTIEVNSVTYKVKSYRYLDEEKLIWLLDCYKP